MARDAGDDLPITLGPCSNGEYDPLPLTALTREAIRRARAAVDVNARRTGMSRRDFLRTACASATTLAVLAACSREQDAADGRGPGGTFDIPPEATTEPDAADEVLGGDEVVFDVQTHLLEYDLSSPLPAQWFGSGFPQADCGDGDPRACFGLEHFLEEILLRSDTAMAVVSAVPVRGGDDPLSIEVRDEARRVADRLCGEGRVLLQGHAYPSDGDTGAALDAMDDAAERFDLSAWKVYTHAAGPGWFLDDHDPGAPQVGAAFLDRVARLGPPIVAVHKGLSGGSRFASPVDLGPAARDHPGISFLAYHSGYEGGGEGAFTDETRDRGVNRLIATVLDHGIGPGGNVYAELGSTWWNLMRAPDEAAHVLGKLLLHLGEDNVLWGTDSIWYGSPQGQIEAFRAFEISPELQERHGYPALTPAIKRKILGGSALRLHGLDGPPERCRFDPAEVADARLAAPGPVGATYGPVTASAARAHRAAVGFS